MVFRNGKKIFSNPAGDNSSSLNLWKLEKVSESKCKKNNVIAKTMVILCPLVFMSTIVVDELYGTGRLDFQNHIIDSSSSNISENVLHCNRNVPNSGGKDNNYGDRKSNFGENELSSRKDELPFIVESESSCTVKKKQGSFKEERGLFKKELEFFKDMCKFYKDKLNLLGSKFRSNENKLDSVRNKQNPRESEVYPIKNELNSIKKELNSIKKELNDDAIVEFNKQKRIMDDFEKKTMVPLISRLNALSPELFQLSYYDGFSHMFVSESEFNKIIKKKTRNCYDNSLLEQIKECLCVLPEDYRILILEDFGKKRDEKCLTSRLDADALWHTINYLTYSFREYDFEHTKPLIRPENYLDFATWLVLNERGGIWRCIISEVSSCLYKCTNELLTWQLNAINNIENNVEKIDEFRKTQNLLEGDNDNLEKICIRITNSAVHDLAVNRT
jgi:hypothetical protein